MPIVCLRGVKNLFTRRYVGDYRLENVSDARGKIRTVPVYRGKRFRFADEAPLKRKILIAALIASAAEIPLLAVNSKLMRTWFFSAPVVLGLIPLILLWTVVVRIFAVKREFRREDRDLFENRFPVSTLLFGILNAAAAVSGILASLRTPKELLLCACPAVCAVCGLWLFGQRKSLKCAELSEDAQNAGL